MGWENLIAFWDLVFTVLLGGVGLYLAHNLRRQLQLKVTDKRLEAYAALWSLMEVATPVRLQGPDPRPLTESEREVLFQAFTHWYYEEGQGMLLSAETKNVYLCAKHNLLCRDDELKPESLRPDKDASEQEHQRKRSHLSIRQLSLLRTRMKADLALYGQPYFERLSREDEAFLRYCGEDLDRKPWGGVGAADRRGLSELPESG